MAIRHIEPMASNAAALGVNALSVAPARAAILQAIDTGGPAASAGFRLTQRPNDDQRAGVVIYQAIYDGDPANAVSRRAAVRGMVFVTLAMDSQLAGLAGKVPDYLSLCVVEAEQGSAAAPPCRSAGLRSRDQPVRPRPVAAFRRSPVGPAGARRSRRDPERRAPQRLDPVGGRPAVGGDARPSRC